ncbi:MAG: T9SS type A sorting domain-containing protein [bacterium]|nr:T9SS type A sorting domain-containing protein [bacterium]
MRRACVVAVLFLLATAPALAQNQLTESVVSGGGAEMTGSHRLRGTLAQSAAGRTVGLNYELKIGYWRSYGESVSAAPDVPHHVWDFRGNHPNPFNPMTTISFSLPAPGQVKLLVYNLRGELVRTLANTNYEAGAHEIAWNGRNDAGAEVASGIYFARLASDHGILTRKMALTR